MVKKILISLLAWKTLLYIIVVVASFFLPFNYPFAPHDRFRIDLPYNIWAWGNFDGHHYMELAERGYQTHEQAFFPLYPLLIHLLFRFLNIPYIIGGQIISLISFTGALYIMIKLLSKDNASRLRNLFLGGILFFPTSFFYTAVYNDSLFLLLGVTCIYFARRKQWTYSSIFGALATLARLNGLALFIFLFFEHLGIKKVKTLGHWLKYFFKDKLYISFLIPSAFIGYLLYIQYVFGSFGVVFSSMKVWNQDKITFPLQVFWRYFKILVLHAQFNFTYVVAFLELVFVLFYVSMMIYSYKKIRFSYWIFFVISIIIPSLTGTFAGMPRYGLHIYPFFLTVALFLNNKGKALQVIYFLISFILLAFFLSFFARGYFVS